MEFQKFLATGIFSIASKKVRDWLIVKWEDEKAFQYAKKELRKQYEEKLKPANYDGIISVLKISKSDIESLPITLEGINLVKFLTQLLNNRIDIWQYNRQEDIAAQLIKDFILKSLEYHLQKADIKDKAIFDIITQIINESNQYLSYLEPLQSYFQSESDFNPLQNIFKNDLLFFTDTDFELINNAYKILKSDRNKAVLIEGQPSSGKTYIALQIGMLFLKEYSEVYYIRLNDSTLQYHTLVNDFSLLKENSLLIIDNCQDRLDYFSNICKSLGKYPKVAFLFILNDISNLEFNVGEFDEFKVTEVFKDSYFKIPANHFNEKAKGIIHKYKNYFENAYKKPFEIGKLQFVINNAHQSLVALYFNLMLWPEYLILDRVDKNKVFERLYKKYFSEVKELDFMLLIASLYKYEIFLDASEIYTEIASELYKRGIVKKVEFSNYYYLFHSSFAKLLLNAYSIHKEYEKYRDDDDFVYHKIREYILSFKKYPQNFDNIFYYLNANHGHNIARNLLQDENIVSRFFDFHKKYKMNVELYLFLLYRLNRFDSKIAERLINEISDVEWRDNLLEMSFNHFSINLLHLDSLNPDKASSIINSIDLFELVEKIKKSNLKFHLLTNAIREIVRISRSKDIGIQILNGLSVDYLIIKIKNSNLIHLGKSISELHATSVQIAEQVIKKIEPTFITKLIEDSNLKSFSKSLNEIKKVHPQLSTILLNNTPDEILLNQLLSADLRLEALSRSLTELSKINPQIAKNLFSKLPTDKLLELIYDSSLIQIAQSLSEFLSIDKKDDSHKINLYELFSKIDDLKLIRKINHNSTKFHTIGNALSLFNIFDYVGKISFILTRIDKVNILAKATKCTFHEFSLGIINIHFINSELSKFILDNYEIELLIRRANSENLDVIGSDLNKLAEVDIKISDKLLHEINWQRIVSRNKNIMFTKLVDSVTALSNYNKKFAQNLLSTIQQLFGPMFFVKRASYVNKNALLDSLNKLYTVDKKIVKLIVIELKKSGHI